MRSVYEAYSYPEDVDVEIITRMPVPSNEKEEVEIAVQKISANLSSIKREMDLAGVQDPEKLMAEILAEQNEQQKAMGDIYNDTK